MTDLSTQDVSPAPVADNKPYVALIDRLYLLGEQLPVSHIISHSPVGKVLAAVIHFLEHGDAILDAAQASADQITEQLKLPVSGRTLALQVPTVLADPYGQAPGDIATTNADDIQALRQQVAALSAQIVNQTSSVTVEPVEPVDSPATADPVVSTDAPPLSSSDAPVDPANS